MAKLENWLSKHLMTTVVSIFVSGFVAVSTAAFGFTQTTVKSDATINQAIAVLDTRLTGYQKVNDERYREIAENTKLIKLALQKYIVDVEVLKATKSN